MATYLSTKDALNVEVSCTNNFFTHNRPKPVNLYKWLTSTQYRLAIDGIRAMATKAERDAEKAKLPAITPSGLFTYVKETDLIRHSGLLQFDIDKKDNLRIRNYDDLKAQICKLPFVAYVGLSASGTGYWGLVPISIPERHSHHFDALKRVFADYRITIDTKPRNVASLRGYSYDSNAYFAERVMRFELYDVPKLASIKRFECSQSVDTERARIEVCISEINHRQLDLTIDYGDWYNIGCAFAKTFGESGRNYFHSVSRFYRSYDTYKTDRQFTACLKANSKATIATFFYLCRKAGIEYKPLMQDSKEELSLTASLHSQQLTAKSVVEPQQVQFVTPTISKQIDQLNITVKPEESQIERLEIKACDSYPVEWDKPIPPGTKPCISAIKFHEWQNQHPLYSKTGIASLKSE